MYVLYGKIAKSNLSHFLGDLGDFSETLDNRSKDRRIKARGKKAVYRYSSDTLNLCVYLYDIYAGLCRRQYVSPLSNVCPHVVQCSPHWIAWEYPLPKEAKEAP